MVLQWTEMLSKLENVWLQKLSLESCWKNFITDRVVARDCHGAIIFSAGRLFNGHSDVAVVETLDISFVITLAKEKDLRFVVC